MPRGDGTGPAGGGGKGAGGGMGGGMGGRGGGGMGGFCVCPSCKKKVPHQRGVPCIAAKCPDCGSQMVREM